MWINDHIPLVSEMPHGGYKQSGYGKDLSMSSLEDYTPDQACDGKDRLSSMRRAAFVTILRVFRLYAWHVPGTAGAEPSEAYE